MITVEQYWMGRDFAYGNELTDEKRANAAKLIDLVNRLIPEIQVAGILLQNHPVNKSPISSGWRPAKINQNLANAAVKSKHMTCQAIDLYDPDGDLGEWAMDNQAVLEKVGLWFESPGSCKGWLHLQSVPFGSYKAGGKRWFYP